MPPRLPLISIPGKTVVYPLGVIPNSSGGLATTPPLLRFSERGLELSSEGKEGLAIVGHGEGRRRLVQTLLAKNKFHPPIPFPGAFPFTSSIKDSPVPLVRHLTFSRPSASGEFTDYTARYGALQEEDKQTLFDFYRSMDSCPTPSEIQKVAQSLRITHLLEVPLIGLSSGQTRRSRIAASFLTGANFLLLEDPFAGLDFSSRKDIGALLGKVNESTMRTVLVLRGTGEVGMPRWIDKVANVTLDNEVWTGTREEYFERVEQEGKGRLFASVEMPRTTGTVGDTSEAIINEPIIDMKDVNVAYGEKKVLDGVSWSIYPGDRIHLQGANGSGKTTILALLLGHHPRSYSMPADNLKIFSKPRREIATPYLRQWIGHTSPEIFSAFPRNMRLTAGDAIGSGYEGVFSKREFKPDQIDRIKSLLEPFKEQLISSPRAGRQASHNRTSIDSIYDAEFSHFPASQQAILLFLRSIVSRPRLLVLDEFSQTIDEQAWEICKTLLEKEWREMKVDGVDPAVVVVSHYESEVPWKGGKVFRLKDGRVDHSE